MFLDNNQQLKPRDQKLQSINKRVISIVHPAGGRQHIIPKFQVMWKIE
jgi:hypothetical protein